MSPPLSFRLCIRGRSAQTSEVVKFSKGVLRWNLVLICTTVNTDDLFSSICFAQIPESPRRLVMSRQNKEGLGVCLVRISSTLDGVLCPDTVSGDGIK